MNEIENLELKISKFLRVGVIFAGTLMLIGWVSQIRLDVNPFFHYQIYDSIPLSELIKFHIYRENWGVLLSYAGLGALISLPLIRVFLTAIIFLKQKEFALAMIAAVVLIGLLISMSLGIEL
jgi:uncharacterized membrane protein